MELKIFHHFEVQSTRELSTLSLNRQDFQMNKIFNQPPEVDSPGLGVEPGLDADVEVVEVDVGAGVCSKPCPRLQLSPHY